MKKRKALEARKSLVSLEVQRSMTSLIESTVKEITDLSKIDLLTPREILNNAEYEDKLHEFVQGKVDGLLINRLALGSSIRAKRQQSRSATADRNLRLLEIQLRFKMLNQQ